MLPIKPSATEWPRVKKMMLLTVLLFIQMMAILYCQNIGFPILDDEFVVACLFISTCGILGLLGELRAVNKAKTSK